MRVSLRRTALALVLTHKATQAPALEAAREFADTLFSILLTAGAGVNPDRADERRVAMWSIGWLTSIPGRLMDCVVTHITTPLIPTEMGSIFESSIVRTSACWALATHGRKPRLASVSAVDARIQNIIVAMREGRAGVHRGRPDADAEFSGDRGLRPSGGAICAWPAAGKA